MRLSLASTRFYILSHVPPTSGQWNGTAGSPRARARRCSPAPVREVLSGARPRPSSLLLAPCPSSPLLAASPTAAAEFDFDFGQALTNGSGYTASTKAAASYNVGEMDALRKAKRDLEEKLAAARHENGFLSAEAARVEMQVSKAREDIAAAECADAEGQAASLRADAKRLQNLLVAADASDRDADGPGLGGVLATAHQEKLALEEEIKALNLKASAAADKDEEEETAAPSTRTGC